MAQKLILKQSIGLLAAFGLVLIPVLSHADQNIPETLYINYSGTNYVSVTFMNDGQQQCLISTTPSFDVNFNNSTTSVKGPFSNKKMFVYFAPQTTLENPGCDYAAGTDVGYVTINVKITSDPAGNNVINGAQGQAGLELGQDGTDVEGSPTWAVVNTLTNGWYININDPTPPTK